MCGNVFDGISDTLTGPAEILVEGDRIARIERSVGRPPSARVIDLSERTVSPGFIDTHAHLTMDAANLALQTLQSSAAKALKVLDHALTQRTDSFSVAHGEFHLSEVDDTSILRTGLPTPLCLSSQLATGLSPLAPRSGLERSDFVHWH